LDFPFPVLVCDIGGTNTRFACLRDPNAPLELGPRVETHEFPTFEAALAFVLPMLPAAPRSLIACVAGPVAGRKVRMTNADWVIDGEAVAARFGLARGLLLNDFEAQALSLPVVKPGWVRSIGPTVTHGPGPRLVMGLGTGLGTAALVTVETRHLALASEAGHMDLAPVGAKEEAVWRHLDRGALGRVTAETVLSGPGLIRLHRARCLAAGEAAPDFDEIALLERAHLDPKGEEARTLVSVWHLLARFAGDLTLAFLAKGGVTFSGGVLPRILPFLDPEAFRMHFEDKAPYTALMKDIGTEIIVAEDVVLHGLAALAITPGAYMIDFSARAWR
jgi:glucokinase